MKARIALCLALAASFFAGACMPARAQSDPSPPQGGSAGGGQGQGRGPGQGRGRQGQGQSQGGGQQRQVPGPGARDEASRLMLEASQLVERGKFAEAKDDYEHALAIREQLLQPDDLAISNTALQLGRTYRQLGRYADAETMFKKSLAIREKAGPDSVQVAAALGGLGSLYVQQGRFDTAEPLLKRALTIEQKPGADDGALAGAMINLAGLYQAEARYADALDLQQHALDIREKKFGQNDVSVAESANAIGVIRMTQGRYGEAEGYFKRALSIDETTLGTDHPTVALVLVNLATDYRNQGRLTESAPLAQRSLAILEKAFGPEHPRVASPLNVLGRLALAENKPADAQRLFQRALAINEATYGPDNPNVALTLDNLGEAYRSQQRFADAETVEKRSLAIREKSYGPDAPSVADSAVTLALDYRQEKRYQEAEALTTRALAIYQKVFGEDHPAVANAYINIAYVHRLQGQTDRAYDEAQKATAIFAELVAREATQRTSADAAQRERYRGSFIQAISIGGAVAESKPASRDTIAAQTLEVAQLTEASSAGRAVANMAARFASGSDALGAAVRERQDVFEQATRLDAAITAAATRARETRDVAAEAALRTQLAATSKRLDDLDARLVRDFPAYAELINPRPVAARDLQAMLAGDEACLVYVIGGEESWLWVVRRQSIALKRLDINAGNLSIDVRTLRRSLDPEINTQLRPFPAGRAYQLYQKIVAPVAPMLDGVHSLIVVPDGALSSLPLGVLVTKPSASDPATLQDNRTVSWLARDYAVTVLPTVSSLRALRQFAPQSKATLPFLGVGDPVLTGSSSSARGVNHMADLFRGGVANVDEVRKLPPLPETADELRKIASTLGASERDLYLRERASEPQIRAAQLDRYRVIEFATHGLIAGDFAGLSEPALVLTPPAVATPANDGLLTASKIASLKLNAEWVVLSACNTAAGDGTPNAGGFSGLTKAVFYAGARSILVSHWAVPSAATVKLTTGAFAELAKNPGIGRAEAFRRSMMAMMDPANPPEFSHPAAWAPFSLVGEGGAGK